MWNTVVTKDDIKSLMNTYGQFHDSCIKEIRYISGAYVQNNLSMCPINSVRTVDVIFQRQYKNPTVIIMRFIGVKILQLAPADENYTCEIYDASVILKDNYFYWIDCGDVVNSVESYKGTLICAEKVEWCIADEYIGNEIIFNTRYDLKQ